MHLVIAFEASHHRGLGHLVRALTLAGALRERGHDVQLVSNREAVARQRCAAAGFPLIELDTLGGNTWQGPLLQAFQPDTWVDDRLATTAEHAQALGAIPRITFDDPGEGALTARFNICGMVPEPPDPAPNGRYGPT